MSNNHDRGDLIEWKGQLFWISDYMGYEDFFQLTPLAESDDGGYGRAGKARTAKRKTIDNEAQPRGRFDPSKLKT